MLLRGMILLRETGRFVGEYRLDIFPEKYIYFLGQSVVINGAIFYFQRMFLQSSFS